MARKSEPEAEPGEARVWAEVSVTVNLGDYESAKITLGESRGCDDTPEARKATRRALHRECEEAVVKQAERVKRIWRQK